MKYEARRYEGKKVVPLSGGPGTCHRHKNRALRDTFFKFGMLLGQAMRFSKTTGYKLAVTPGDL